MKKLFILITLTILAAGTLLFTQSAPIGEQARLLLILPVHNLSKKSDTEKTEKYTVLLWRSLYNFTLHIPSMEVPPRDEIDDLEWDAANLGEIASNFQAAFIIAGEVSLADSRLAITVTVWDGVKNQAILQKTYDSATDFELLDTLDTIINNSVSAVLDTPVAIASLNFTDIKISDKPVDIFINGKKHATVGKSGYSDTLKILAGYAYKIEFIDSAGTILNSMNVSLKDGETVKIEFAAPVNPSVILPGTWLFSMESFESVSPDKAMSILPDGNIDTGSIINNKFVKMGKMKWKYLPAEKTFVTDIGGVKADWQFGFIDEAKIHLTNSSGEHLYLVKQAGSSQSVPSVIGIPLVYTSDDKFEKKHSQELAAVRGLISLYFENLKEIYYEAYGKNDAAAENLNAALEAAKNAQAGYVIYGDLNKKSGSYTGTVKVWSAAKKKDVYTEKFAFKDSPELVKKINALCGNIAAKGLGLKPQTGTIVFDIAKGIYNVKISDKPVFAADYIPMSLKLTLPSGGVYTVNARIKSLNVFYKEKIFLTNGAVYTVKAVPPKTKIAKTYIDAFKNVWSVCKFGENPYKSDFFLRLGNNNLAETGVFKDGEFAVNGKGAWDVIDENRIVFTGLDPKKLGGLNLAKVSGYHLKQKGDDYYFILKDAMNTDIGTIGFIKSPKLVINSAAVKSFTAKFAGVWGVAGKANAKKFDNYLKFDVKGNIESGSYEDKKFKKKKAGKWEIIDGDTLQWTINNLKAKFNYVIDGEGIVLKGEGQKLFLTPMK
ncbi:MAG: hypothetical protein A2Y33_03720 [Spirochaetes bacterium GWF1_51_8]|nr:MAG: hypothetical protein A2Y33_03720 [Spirochaetes bacterium GWF1_51_8]